MQTHFIKGICIVKALKGLVIGMGVLIIAGLGLLGYGLSTTYPSKKTPSTLMAHSDPNTKGFGQLKVNEKSGSTIAHTLLEGQTILIHVQGNGPDRLHVVDIASGQHLGVITLTTE